MANPLCPGDEGDYLLPFKGKNGYTNSVYFFGENEMITVEVRLYATLLKYRPGLGIGEPFFIKLDDKANLGNLFDELKIPNEEIKVAFVNGRWEAENYVLRDGDRIGIFPPIGGG